VLLSRNDVGFDPEVFSAPPEAFHAACQARAQAFPRNLLATATHDHKRGEDTRARLAVISERATWYGALVTHWQAMASSLRGEYADAPAPSGGDEAMLYQALLGSWPLDLQADDLPALEAYAERMLQWQQKALREAKLISSWSAPNEPYERACRDFLHNLLTADSALALRQSIVSAVQVLAPTGALNSLVQCTLKATSPGIPDLYQGTEFWDFSLVDPDNRRPVDYTARSEALAGAETAPQLLGVWQDGRVKQALVAALLNARAEHSALFLQGDYLPLETGGEQGHRIIAFARHYQGRYAIVVAPRLCSELLSEGALLIATEKWGDTYVRLPENLSSLEFKGLFSTQVVTLDKDLRVSEALKEFPVNLYLQSDS
jgi:(1->4)-alpha-D-glucan 1-alpha-D-glucosylmutase